MTVPSPSAWTEFIDRLGRIETMLLDLIRAKAVKEWYTTSEAAERLGKSEYTVREWCRLGRCDAKKKSHARGRHPEWLISHDELLRIEREGLRSMTKPSS